jgi:TetR/AcrR family transcriptional regulator, ethionamide resistance regulator
MPRMKAARRARRSPRGPAHRRTNDAEEMILRAALKLLCTRPFRDVTIDHIMRKTRLSRPAFYVYFRDLHDLVIRLFERFAAEFYAVADRWLIGSDDRAADARAAIEGVVATYARHGRFLRAAVEATSWDKRVDQAYRTIMNRLVAAIAGHVRTEIDAGRARKVDPEETASALVLMTEAHLRERFGRNEDADRERATETLLTIWVRTLYD